MDTLTPQAPVQGQISFGKTFKESVIDANGGDEWWQSLAQPDKDAAAQAYQQKYVAPVFDQQKVDQADQEAYYQAFNQTYGASMAIAQKSEPGIAGVGQALVDWGKGLGDEIGNAGLAEYQSIQKDPVGSVVKPYAFAVPSAIEGVRNLLQMPSDLLTAGQSAYEGKQKDPIYTLPSVKDIPVLGQAYEQFQKEHPIYDFAAQGAIPVEKGLELLRGRVAKAGTRAIEATPAIEAKPIVAPTAEQVDQAIKAKAKHLYDQLNAQDTNVKAQAQIAIKDIRRRAGRAKDPVKYQENPTASQRNAANINAKKVMIELDNLYKAQKPAKPGTKTLDVSKLPTLAKAGAKYVEQGGAAKKTFQKVVKKYRPEDQLKINREIEKTVGKKREAQAKQVETQRKRTATKTQQAKAEKTKQKAEQKALEDKAKAARAEANAAAKMAKAEDVAQQKKARELEKEAQAAERLARAPKVLDNADIETLSDELVEHSKKNEKGDLDGKLAYYRKAAKEDLTKYGLSKERAEATQQGYRRVLNAYTQKTAKTKVKPTAYELKEGQEYNRVALSKLNEEGGRFNPGDEKALQVPSKGMTLEQVQKTAEWDELDSITKQKAEDAMDAAAIDAGVVIEYDAERAGDTGQFKLKTVYPKSLDFIDGRLTMRAANRYGHEATYYLSPSKPNAATGLSSYTHDLIIMPETAGKGKFKGLEANIYHGQREVPVKEILERPYRDVPTKTHVTEARLKDPQNAYGQSVSKLNKRLNKDLKKAANSVELNKPTQSALRKGGFDKKDVQDVVNGAKKQKKNLEKGTDC